MNIQIMLISVQSPPYIIKQPPTDEVLFKVKARADENDKPFVIECEAEGEPQPQWVDSNTSASYFVFTPETSSPPTATNLRFIPELFSQFMKCLNYTRWKFLVPVWTSQQIDIDKPC